MNIIFRDKINRKFYKKLFNVTSGWEIIIAVAACVENKEVRTGGLRAEVK